MISYFQKMDFSSDYRVRNKKVFDYIEAVIEKLIFGEVRAEFNINNEKTLKIDFEVHNKRITSIQVYGRQSIRPSKNKEKDEQNLEMLAKLIERIKKATDNKQSMVFDFKVIIKKGKIEEIDYYSSYKIYFE